MLFVWLKFFICVLLVLFFGAKLSRYGDVVAEKTGLSGLWVGLLLLAAVTAGTLQMPRTALIFIT